MRHILPIEQFSTIPPVRPTGQNETPRGMVVRGGRVGHAGAVSVLGGPLAGCEVVVAAIGGGALSGAIEEAVADDGKGPYKERIKHRCKYLSKKCLPWSKVHTMPPDSASCSNFRTLFLKQSGMGSSFGVRDITSIDPDEFAPPRTIR